MEKKQTAVEWLVEEIHKNGNWIPTHMIEQAKEMEKEQIVNAWNGGEYDYFYSKETGRDFKDGEDYYNEVYGGGDE